MEHADGAFWRRGEVGGRAAGRTYAGDGWGDNHFYQSGETGDHGGVAQEGEGGT